MSHYSYYVAIKKVINGALGESSHGNVFSRAAMVMLDVICLH